MTTIILIFLAVEIVVGALFAVRTRDMLHLQIVSGPIFTWKSKTIPIEQELSDLRTIGVLMVITGSTAGVCILNMNKLVQALSGA